VHAADWRLINGSARGNRRRNSAAGYKAMTDHYSAFRPLISESASSLWLGRCLGGRDRFLRATWCALRICLQSKASEERCTVNSRDRDGLFSKPRRFGIPLDGSSLESRCIASITLFIPLSVKGRSATRWITPGSMLG